MKTKLLLSAAVLAGGFAVTPAIAQEVEGYGDRSARRCCIVEEGRWVRDPWSNWTPRDCRALGEEGEYAPQGTGEAGACAADPWPEDGEPDPSPPPHDDGDDEGEDPGEEDDGEDPRDENGGRQPVTTYGGERAPGERAPNAVSSSSDAAAATAVQAPMSESMSDAAAPAAEETEERSEPETADAPAERDDDG